MKRAKPKSHSKTSNHSHNSSPSLKSFIEPPPDFFPSKHEFLRLIVVLAFASAVAWTCNLFLTSFINPSTKPFCDSNVDFPDSFSDDCEPCPSNGACYDGKLECLQGYRKHGKLCVEDGDINKSAKKISDRVKCSLCEDYAQYLCYGVGSVWVQEDEIWKRFDNFEPMENVLLDNALYNYTKQRAIETMAKLVEMRTNSLGKEFKCPDLLVEHYKPYSCRIHQWVSQHILAVLPICAMLVGCTFFIWKIYLKLCMSRRVEELYNQVCEILEENAVMSKNVNGECEPWIVASRLRDHLLLPRERKDPLLWKKLEELVQEDSRVDRYPKLVKGESKVVWEWQVEGSLSSSKMKRKIDASKMKVSEGADLSSQQCPIPKTEAKELLF
ncbi:uncharacterized protein LOC129296555 isoform X2 [Prosopis cineraria]|uniref:uncharacterized protein LOC129296555 isoform X2 n=1 Tax=Prosopis cineraria TaxID=364024 RepID=UPI00240F210D|nr:uncharacterized protein LOC129296555 isoform X2 [Prosopis cineraria]